MHEESVFKSSFGQRCNSQKCVALRKNFKNSVINIIFPICAWAAEPVRFFSVVVFVLFQPIFGSCLFNF